MLPEGKDTWAETEVGGGGDLWQEEVEAPGQSFVHHFLSGVAI